MTYDRDFFTPEHVDEQVDQLSQHPRGAHVPHNKPAGELSQPGAYLVEDLKAYYNAEQQRDIASLERAWKRVAVKLPTSHEHSPLTSKPPSNILSVPQERTRKMRNAVISIPHKGNIPRQLGLLASVLVAALLVGGLITVLNLSHRTGIAGSPGIPAKSSPIPAATSTPATVFGKTLYTTPSNPYGFNGLAWSPDSKRVASSTIDPHGVQMWDATTGKHLVTVQLPGANEGAYNLAWSPNSQSVAVATDQHLLIVDGQTGKVIHAYNANAQTASSGTSTSSGQSFLSTLLPTSGGLGYRAVSWSPDGKLIAAAVSSGTSGTVQVLNPQTGAINFTLQPDNNYNIGSLAWSPDGQYIAGSTWNTQGSQPYTRIAAWNVSTHQIVFRHDDYASSNAPLAWQPQTHNLAWVGATSSGKNLVVTLEIWNPVTGKPVQQYVRTGSGTGALDWSPDGKYLAYADQQNAKPVVNILDVTTGKVIYVYKGHRLAVSLIAWSPNGNYIASAEGNSQGQMVAKVWTA